MNVENSGSAELYLEALQLLKRGLELLDEAQAPAEIGANVDLAICRLEEHLQGHRSTEAKVMRAAGDQTSH